MKKRHEQKLVILSLALLALFNMPFILMWEKTNEVLGFPVIYIYIFSVWMLSVFVSVFIIQRYGQLFLHIDLLVGVLVCPLCGSALE